MFGKKKQKNKKPLPLMFLCALWTHSAAFNICRLAVSFYQLTLTVAFSVWLLSHETPTSGVKRFYSAHPSHKQHLPAPAAETRIENSCTVNDIGATQLLHTFKLACKLAKNTTPVKLH